VLHLLDQGILLIYSALNRLDINIIWSFHGLQGFGELCQILFLAHAEGWLWRPLLRQKDMGFFHWRNQEFKFLPVENQAVFGFTKARQNILALRRFW
jgi:hypothetical protein